MSKRKIRLCGLSGTKEGIAWGELWRATCSEWMSYNGEQTSSRRVCWDEFWLTVPYFHPKWMIQRVDSGPGNLRWDLQGWSDIEQLSLWRRTLTHSRTDTDSCPCLAQCVCAGRLSPDGSHDLGWMCEVSAMKKLWLPVSNKWPWVAIYRVLMVCLNSFTLRFVPQSF